MTDDLNPPEVQRLLTFYEIERQDEQYTAALLGAYTGVGLVYAIAAATYIAQVVKDRVSPPGWFLALIPLPGWILVGLITFHGLASQVRQDYIIEIEERLAHRVSGYRRFPRFTALQRGLYAPITRGWCISFGHKRHSLRIRNLSLFLLAVGTWITPALVAAGLTYLAVWTGGSKVHLHEKWQIVACVLYGIFVWVCASAITWPTRFDNRELLDQEAKRSFDSHRRNGC